MNGIFIVLLMLLLRTVKRRSWVHLNTLYSNIAVLQLMVFKRLPFKYCYITVELIKMYLRRYLNSL